MFPATNFKVFITVRCLQKNYSTFLAYVQASEHFMKMANRLILFYTVPNLTNYLNVAIHMQDCIFPERVLREKSFLLKIVNMLFVLITCHVISEAINHHLG